MCEVVPYLKRADNSVATTQNGFFRKLRSRPWYLFGISSSSRTYITVDCGAKHAWILLALACSECGAWDCQKSLLLLLNRNYEVLIVVLAPYSPF